MTDKNGCDRHFQSERSNGLSDRIIIGELIGEDLKASDTPERLRAYRDGCARARLGKAKLQPYEGTRQKMPVDACRGEPGPKAAERKSVIEAGHETYVGCKQRRSHAWKG